MASDKVNLVQSVREFFKVAYKQQRAAALADACQQNYTNSIIAIVNVSSIGTSYLLPSPSFS